MSNKLPPHKNRKEIPEYHTWKNMRARCNAPCNKDNRFYQSKNINVCDEWNDFVVFYNDMGPKPTTLHSIDRIDNDGNYEPSNCRWADNTIQANNKSNNTLVNYAGKVYTIPELGRSLDISIIALRKHIIDKGRSVEEALERIKHNTYLEYNNELKTREEWCQIYGIKKSNLHSRLSKGWTVERALTTPERKSPSKKNLNNMI